MADALTRVTVKSETGQSVTTTGARIAGLVSCVPSRVVTNEYFESQFGSAVDDVTKMTGIHERRWVDDQTTTSDLCAAAAAELLDGLEWDPESVDALIFVSQTPDFRLPATSTVLQHRLGLRKGIIAYDVNLGCSAYPYGLWMAQALVSSGGARRVLLAVGDTSTKLVDSRDRATAMLFGDAGAVTAIEPSAAAKAHFILGSDGSGASNLIVPHGAFREAPHRSPNHPDKLFMDGGEIFTFTLRAVPPLIKRTLEYAGRGIADYDAFLFHQANTFMINHIVKKAKLPADLVPMNISRFGNTSSATIPLLMADCLGNELQRQELSLAMFGFGVGYSWGGASLRVGPLDCVKLITL